MRSQVCWVEASLQRVPEQHRRVLQLLNLRASRALKVCTVPLLHLRLPLQVMGVLRGAGVGWMICLGRRVRYGAKAREKFIDIRDSLNLVY